MEPLEVGDIVWVPLDTYPAVIVASGPETCFIKWLHDFGYDYNPIQMKTRCLAPFDLDKLINNVINDDI